MNKQTRIRDARTNDPYLDRRSREDRWQAYDLDYFPGDEIDNDPFEQDMY